MTIPSSSSAPSPPLGRYVKGQKLYRAEAAMSLTRLGWRGDVMYYPFIVRKVTAKGAWVSPPEGPCEVKPGIRPTKQGFRFIQKGGRWCSPTKEEALQHLKARTKSYVRHCRRRLNAAEARAMMLGVYLDYPLDPLPFDALMTTEKL